MPKNYTEKEHATLLRIKSLVQSFAALSLIWLALIFLLSVIEISLNSNFHGLPLGFIKLLMWSFYIDLLFWLKFIPLLFIIYAILYLIAPKLANFSFKLFISLIFAIQLLLISYFNTALVMLGADLFGYSLEDIIQTVGASGGVSIVSAVLFILLVLFNVAILNLLPKRFKLNFILAAVIVILAVIYIPVNAITSWNKVNLKSDYANNLITNKSEHFYSAAYDHYFPEIYEIDIYADSYIGDFIDKLTKAIPFEYVDEENYPFLHKEIENDVLTPFFEPGTEKPNIVIILVEGLGRAFTNSGAYLGNFTPYLDSLSSESLYWKNFMSEGGRTFAVLPSVLGSLPFGQNGYLAMGPKMPEQLSMINLLNANGYRTSFYYGGDSGFDNMSQYLKLNNIDEINDLSTFPSSKYPKLPANNGFSWGYSDKALYQYYLDTRPVNSSQPQLSVLLTLATHSPFLIEEKERYTKKFEERLTELGFDNSKKESYRNYEKQYVSILYADDAIKEFMDSYRKRADFKNTIFLITGDHRIPEIPMSTKLDRYHVPFIVYSPMLKRTAEMNSVSTHFDIAPSLLSFLETNYSIKLPATMSWVGKGLDTTRAFQNIHEVPLMQTKTDLIDFIMGEYHLNGDNLYRFNEKMEEVLIDDVDKKAQLINAFNLFKKRNAEIIKGRKIVPDSIFQNYTMSN